MNKKIKYYAWQYLSIQTDFLAQKYKIKEVIKNFLKD